MTPKTIPPTTTPLTRHRFRNILLVGNPYSAFVLEEAGFRPADQTEPADAPAFRLARTAAQALEMLQRERVDMAIVEYQLPDETGMGLAAKLREFHPLVYVVVVTSNTDLGGANDAPTGDATVAEPREAAPLFISYGSPTFWRALVRLQEDECNILRLSESGALVILLVEDEPNFYSHFLPALYEHLRAAVVDIMPEARRRDSAWRISEKRPLILLRRNFESACETLFQYRKNMMALISDMCFPVAGERRTDAGLRLLYRARALHQHLPVVVGSRDKQFKDAVLAADAKFMWKDSPRLMSDLDNFLSQYCGFGPFVFRWPAGERYGMARNLNELRDLIADVPDVVFEYHALHNDFSTWLAVHGYHQLALRMRALLVTEPDIRATLLRAIDDELAQPAE